MRTQLGVHPRTVIREIRFLRLGNGETSGLLHNPGYDFADASLTTGAALWARLAERYLERV